MNDLEERVITELEAIKTARDDQRRAYQRSYYSLNKDRIKEARLRKAAETFLERLQQQRSF